MNSIDVLALPELAYLTSNQHLLFIEQISNLLIFSLAFNSQQFDCRLFLCNFSIQFIL